MALKKTENKKNDSKKDKKGRRDDGPITGLRVNYLIIFLSGLVILIAAILVFLLIVKNVYGNYEFSEILPTKENLEKFTYAEKAGILYSVYTENMLDDGDTWIQDNLDTWTTFMKNINMQYDIISDQDIELGKHYKYELLVLAGAKAISDKEIIEIKKYLDQGGSVFTTGGVATFSDEAKWRGWNFFTETFGMKFTKELTPEDAYSKVHTLRGNLPLTAGIPTGYSLRIATWDRPIYAEILEPRTMQVSYWFDYRTDQGLVREEIQKSAGISYGTYGKGRFVWYGFELNSVIGSQEVYINFEKLFKNSVNWLTYQPTSFVKDWPAPYDGAAIFIPTISENVSNVSNIKGLINNYNYPATVFVDLNTAIKNPGTIKSVAKYAEIGAIVDIGYLESMFDTENKLFDKKEQSFNINFVIDTLQKISNSNINGIMPYYGFYDENTLSVMAESNLRYLVTDSLTDRSVPNLVVMDEKPVMIITRTARDDNKIIKQYGLTDLEFQRYTYFEDVDRLLFEGGLYVLKVHTDYQLQPQYVGVINDIVKYIRSKNIWFTSIDELLNWWQRKGGLEIRYETRSKRRISVEVSNHKDDKTDDFVVQVNFNKSVNNVEISSDMIHTPIPEFEFDESTNVIYLYIEDLEPGETRIFLVDFENQQVEEQNL